MKAEQLMIGDWISNIGNWMDTSGTNRFEKVEKVYPYSIETNHSERVFEDNLKPIPITPEILEKNGFVKEGNYGNYIMELRVANITFLHTTKYYLRINGITHKYEGLIKYVHELQHALRICKIDKEIEL